MKKDGKRERLGRIKKFRHKEIIAFSIVMFIIYLSTLTCSPDDEDTLLFIKGVKNFDVAKFSPHPPGYPVYIFLGKISYFFIEDDLLSLAILSAIFGALSLAVFYFLIFEMFDKKTALISSVILAVTPMFWLESLKAMTDMTGLFFILLSMYFIYKSIKYKKLNILYLGSFISGLAIGARFHAIMIVIPLLIYAKIKLKDGKNNRKKIIYTLGFFFIGVLVWLIPTLIANGFFEYFEACLRQFLRRFDKPGMAAVGGELSSSYLLPRISSFFKYFLGRGYGIDLSSFSVLPVIASLLYLFFLLLSYEKLKDKRLLFFVVGLVFYVIMIFLFLPPHNPRYLLPLIPFISLLFAFGISWFERFDKLAFLVIFTALLINSAPLAVEIHTIDAPSVQLVSYIKANYDLNETFIFRDTIVSGHFRYYSVNTSSYDSLEYYNLTTLSQNKTILFVNPTCEYGREYNLTLIKVFERDFRIHGKDAGEVLYKLEKDL